MIENVDQVIDQMKTIGDRLVEYNWPQGPPQLEQHINVLKMRDLDVDGYPVTVHFGRADYDKSYLETLQIMSRNGVFLPFHLVAKLGKKFLGSHHLYLVEVFKDGRKIYCWTVTLDKHGRPIDPPNQQYAEDCVYDGFKYRYMYPQHVNFY